MKSNMITTLEECDLKLDYNKKNSICKLAFQGIDLTNSQTIQFSIDNGWNVVGESSRFGSSWTSFDVRLGGKYYSHKCLDCKSKFNSPIEIKKCIVCSSENLNIIKNKIKKTIINESIAIHPDIVKQATQDLREHPVPVEESIDWNHLANTIGD